MTRSSDPGSIIQTVSQTRAVYTALQGDRVGFNRLAEILRLQTGINLPENPKNLGLMASRLVSTMNECGCHSYSQYLAWLDREGQAEVSKFVECMTTNTTEFNREPGHFDVLRELLSGRLPGGLNFEGLAKQRELRIWCAAASSGQEPYTILMTIMSELEAIRQFPDMKFLATDIDRTVLEQASCGVYSMSEMKSLPPQMHKWFKPLGGANDDHPRFVADKRLREGIVFAQMNLVDFPYSFKHGFDIVFCRNVLIYFDQVTSEKVIAEITRHLRPGGFLFLGHSEAGVIRPSNLKHIANAVYRKDQK